MTKEEQEKAAKRQSDLREIRRDIGLAQAKLSAVMSLLNHLQMGDSPSAKEGIAGLVSELDQLTKQVAEKVKVV